MSASTLPIPEPPRTPSPLSEDNDSPSSKDIGGHSLLSRESQDSLPPMSSTFRDRNGSTTSLLSIPSNGSVAMSPRVAELAGASGVTSAKNPFDFQTTTYVAGAPPSVKSNMGQRRGHKYKHSSVSHQIIQEPTPKAPLRLPASLPIPTLKECWSSLTREQTLQVGWCFCHLFVAAYVQWTAQGSLALTALSHLIFYDAIGAFLCAGVEVLSKFEVWRRPTIRQPFGLERSEVLVGFAMSILLLFMGFDLISHNVGHALQDVGNHEAHHEHKHTRVSPGSVDVVSLLAIISTLVSAVMLQNHVRTAKALRFGTAFSFLPSVLNNPSHLLTLSCSGLLLLLPLLSVDMYNWVDKTLSTFMALCMCIFGVQLVQSLGSMLLMSYSPSSFSSSIKIAQGGSIDGISGSASRGSGSGDINNTPSVGSVLQDIETDPCVLAIEEAKFWQVHYALCMANLKLRVTKSTDESSMLRLRERVNNLIKNKLGGGFGTGGGVNWEVSTQLSIDKP